MLILCFWLKCLKLFSPNHLKRKMSHYIGFLWYDYVLPPIYTVGTDTSTGATWWVKLKRRRKKQIINRSELSSYFLCWSLTSCKLFSFVSNTTLALLRFSKFPWEVMKSSKIKHNAVEVKEYSEASNYIGSCLLFEPVSIHRSPGWFPKSILHCTVVQCSSVK